MNQAQGFNNNFHSSLNPNDLRQGYSIQNNAAAANNNYNNNPTNIGESNKTATFNKKFSTENEVEVSMNQSKDDLAENKSQVIINFTIKLLY